MEAKILLAGLKNIPLQGPSDLNCKKNSERTHVTSILSGGSEAALKKCRSLKRGLSSDFFRISHDSICVGGGCGTFSGILISGMLPDDHRAESLTSLLMMYLLYDITGKMQILLFGIYGKSEIF